MSINIINQYINFSKKCINKYMKFIMQKKFNQDIFDELIKTYIDVRYYDLYEHQKKSNSSNITYYLSEKTHVLMQEENKSKSEKENIKNMFLIFYYILVFDNVISCDSAKQMIKKLNDFRIDKLNINEDNFEKEMFDMVKEDLLRKKQYITNFDNKDFNTIYNKTNIKNLYNVEIESKIKFPKIYSKYAIDKVFVSKEINEHKLFIIYPIVAAKILSNIIDGQFNKQYLIDYNINLINKEKKLKRLFSFIDDDVTKEKIIIKINFTDFLSNKNFFVNSMKSGFNYAVRIDNKFKLDRNNIDILKFFKYIVIKNSHANYKELCNLNNVVIDR